MIVETKPLIYRLVYRGQIVEGFKAERVLAALSEKLKLTEQHKARISSDAGLVLKTAPRAEDLIPYRDTLHKFGAISSIELATPPVAGTPSRASVGTSSLHHRSTMPESSSGHSRIHEHDVNRSRIPRKHQLNIVKPVLLLFLLAVVVLLSIGLINSNSNLSGHMANLLRSTSNMFPTETNEQEQPDGTSPVPLPTADDTTSDSYSSSTDYQTLAKSELSRLEPPQATRVVYVGCREGAEHLVETHYKQYVAHGKVVPIELDQLSRAIDYWNEALLKISGGSRNVLNIIRVVHKEVNREVADSVISQFLYRMTRYPGGIFKNVPGIYSGSEVHFGRLAAYCYNNVMRTINGVPLVPDPPDKMPISLVYETDGVYFEMKEIHEKGVKQAEAFLASNKLNPGVREYSHLGGVQLLVLRDTNNPFPRYGDDIVTLRYSATTVDGESLEPPYFTSGSYSGELRDIEQFEISKLIGSVRIGAHYRFYCPPGFLGASLNWPLNTILVLDLEVLDIRRP